MPLELFAEVPPQEEQRIITVRNNALIRGQNHKVLGFLCARLIDDWRIQATGRQLFGFLQEGNPDYDPNSNYCISFSGVLFFSSPCVGKINYFNALHKRYRGRPVSLTDMCPDVFETFAVTKLTRLYDIKDTVEDYLRVQG